MSGVETARGGHLKAREQHVENHRTLDGMSYWVQGCVGGLVSPNAVMRGVMKEEIGATSRCQSRKCLGGQLKECGLFPEDNMELLRDLKQGSIKNKARKCHKYNYVLERPNSQ